MACAQLTVRGEVPVEVPSCPMSLIDALWMHNQLAIFLGVVPLDFGRASGSRPVGQPVDLRFIKMPHPAEDGILVHAEQSCHLFTRKAHSQCLDNHETGVRSLNEAPLAAVSNSSSVQCSRFGMFRSRDMPQESYIPIEKSRFFALIFENCYRCAMPARLLDSVTRRTIKGGLELFQCGSGMANSESTGVVIFEIGSEIGAP